MNKIDIKLKKILKQMCIDVQNNKFVTPIVERDARKIKKLFLSEIKGVKPEFEEDEFYSEILWEYACKQMYYKIFADFERKIEELLR